MACSSSSETPAYNFVATDKHIEYCIAIPGLRISKHLFRPNEAANGHIDCNISEKGFTFSFVGKGDLKGKNYDLVVKNFPCQISPCGSSYKPRENAVDIKLNVQPSNPKEIEAMLQDERYVEEKE